MARLRTHWRKFVAALVVVFPWLKAIYGWFEFMFDSWSRYEFVTEKMQVMARAFHTLASWVSTAIDAVSTPIGYIATILIGLALIHWDSRLRKKRWFKLEEEQLRAALNAVLYLVPIPRSPEKRVETASALADALISVGVPGTVKDRLTTIAKKMGPPVPGPLVLVSKEWIDDDKLPKSGQSGQE